MPYHLETCLSWKVKTPYNNYSFLAIIYLMYHCNLGSTLQASFDLEYELVQMSTGVCINCNFLDSFATDCVAVVHQRVSQLSSSGLMNIESSHKFNRSGDTAYGCIEGVNLEQYDVGVIGSIRSPNKILPSMLWIT